MRASDDLAKISRTVGKIFLPDGSVMTDKKKKQKMPYQNWLVPGAIGLVFLAGIGFVIRVMLTDVGPRKREQISTVTLIKPPPPEVKEKPPEPQIQKEAPKETIVAPAETPQDQAQNQPDDGPPAGSDLGVDAAGGAGSDAFGLVGKKGGRAITLGDGNRGGLGRLSLLTRYGGYSQKMTEDIKKRVYKFLDQNGGAPKGKFQTTIHVTLNDRGKVLTYRIVGPTGNAKIDDAFKATLGDLIISSPPPAGMPLSMTLKVTMSQG